MPPEIPKDVQPGAIFPWSTTDGTRLGDLEILHITIDPWDSRKRHAIAKLKNRTAAGEQAPPDPIVLPLGLVDRG